MAKGKYIAFVDSDDYVDPDYFRSMVCAAEANDADLVASRIVEENENGNKIEYNLCNIGEWDLRGEKIIEPFMDQAGRNFWWHAIWNKIVSRDLISKCRAHYDAIEEHLIMGEDLVYSIVFFSYAKHFISTEIRGYFYLKNQSASTSLRGNVVKFRKNIGDLNQVFTFCEQFLKNVELFSKYETQYIEWKARYSRYWVTNVLIAALSKRERTDLLIYIKTAFNQEQSIESREEDHYFYSIRTEFDERYLNVKKWIIKESRNIRYVSFDLFDTMVTRPFYEPSDLFVLLNKYYQKLYNSRGLFDFSTIRKSAEADLRKRQSIQRPSYQEITIAEIYLAISETLRVAPSSLSTLMQKEMDLEESFCTPRKSIKELFELVKDLGLKLICITDTYLPREVIERILAKNGYSGFSAIYVSSEERLTKETGDLFKRALRDLDCESRELIHIDDNWPVADLAMRNGIKQVFYPKSRDVFLNWTNDKHHGSHSDPYRTTKGTWENYTWSMQYFGIRCMIAMVANKIFDNPFLSFQSWSDYNCRSRIPWLLCIGYVHSWNCGMAPNRSEMQNSSFLFT